MHFSTITKEALKEKLDLEERLQVVDIRSFAAYWSAHIKGAISLPYDAINDRADELLDPDLPLVLYGEDDQDAIPERAAEGLVGRGVDVTRITLLSDGLIGWRGGGFFTNSGDEP